MLLALGLIATSAVSAMGIRIHADHVQAGAVARVIARRADLEVCVAPALAKRRISVRFEDTPAEEALRVVALLVGETLRREHGRWAIGDAPDSRNAAIRSRATATCSVWSPKS